MHAVPAVRRFNRFYTRRIGVLRAGHLDSPFTLAEVRVLYELAHRERPTASDLARDLSLDPGYLSRMLHALRRRGLVTRTRSATDGRRAFLALTALGRRRFAALDKRQDAETRLLVSSLPPLQQRRLVGAMQTIEGLLALETRTAPFTIRTSRPGDLGWIVHRHGALYAEEYGWDERFEALVARVAADFLASHDPARERCWVAELDGEIVGSILLVAKSRTVAKLRLLLVEPSARGLGIGSRLVSELLSFARAAGYRRVVLWTNDILDAARRIYERAGFTLVESAPHAQFGTGLIGQTWELALTPAAPRRRRTRGAPARATTRRRAARRRGAHASGS
jgi:DNA-binding MarR family transcriptional regulator/GNAT superfamily N-acetyltransferase